MMTLHQSVSGPPQQMSGILDFLLGLGGVTKVGLLLGGGALLVLGNQERFRGTPARSIMNSAGGILVALGVLTFVV